MIRNGLWSIERECNPNDVVLIYWLGRDAVQDQGKWYLPTSDSPPPDKGLDLDTMVPLDDLLGGQPGAAGARVLLLDVGAPVSPSVGLSRTRAAVLREAWSKQDRPVPGLLMALEDAVVAGKRQISLRDLEKAAEKFRVKYSDSLELTSNLDVVPLSGLVLTQKP
jgi:hypothetical protein